HDGKPRRRTLTRRQTPVLLSRIVVSFASRLRTIVLPALAVGGSLIAIGFAGLPGTEESRPRNVILISVDALDPRSLRAHRPSAAEHPNLDRLAGEALVFRKAYSSASWTLPAHASLLTGLYSDRHGATDRRRGLRDGTTTLAAVLEANDVETVAFTDGGYLDPQFGLAAGFERYDQLLAEEPTEPSSIPRRGRRASIHEGLPFDRGIAFLQQRGTSSRPFFLFLHTYLVHDYFKLHPWATPGVESGALRTRREYLACLVGKASCNPTDWRVLRELYFADLAYLDGGLGRLLRAIQEAGLRESTLVVLVSDHGESFDFERQRTGHGGRLHDDQLRIPLWLAGPGITPGASDQPVSIVDVMPTILAAVGLPVPEELDGRPLPSTPGAAPGAERPIYAMSYYHWWHGRRRIDSTNVRTEPLAVAVLWKDLAYIRSKNGEELYDMTTDPDQRRNLADVSRHRDELRRLSLARSDHRPAGAAVVEKPELTEHLRALGYLQ
ncbi:MAG: sulfatase, partial [Candidatus Binatia bacterium]